MTQDVLDMGSVWFGNSSAGSTLYLPGSSLGPRVQAYVQLIFLHFGSISVHVDGKRHDLVRDSVTLLLPGHEEYFEFATDGETLHSYVHIDPGALSQSVHDRLAPLPRSIPLSKAMDNLIHQATNFTNTPSSTRTELLEAMALQLLWHYVGEAEALGWSRDTATYHQTVPEAQLYVHDHLDADLNLESIASAVGVSNSHLIRLFKEQLGITPMRYVWQQRVAAGVELLKHSGLSIETITERCGFESRFHFSRRIKQATSMPPRELRQAYWSARWTPFEPPVADE